MAIVVKGDAMSSSDLKKAFSSIEDVDAVISTIGGTPADPSSDSQVGGYTDACWVSANDCLVPASATIMLRRGTST